MDQSLPMYQIQSCLNLTNMILNRILSALGLLAIFLFTVFFTRDKAGQNNFNVCLTSECRETANRILSHMDEQVNPCVDFYRFACGKFLKTAKIDAAKDDIKTIDVVYRKLHERLWSIINEAPDPREPRPYYNMKHLFQLCMDMDKIESRGTAHALALLREAGGWPVLGDWKPDNWHWLHSEIKQYQLFIGGGNFFSVDVISDLTPKSDRYIIMIDQGGLGLDRTLLMQGMKNSVVQSYLKNMVSLAVLYGADYATAENQLRTALLFELELAEIKETQDNRRDISALYNQFTLNKLEADERLGWIDWRRLLKGMRPLGLDCREDDPIIITHPEYFLKLRTLLEKTQPEVIANYMMWRSAKLMSGSLTSQMEYANFEFMKEATGKTSRIARQNLCMTTASSYGLVLSSIFVKRYFDETSKKDALEMVERIQEQLLNDLKEIDWMDDVTRQRAEQKAMKMRKSIGYPDELLDVTKLKQFYEGLELEKEENYFEALQRMMKWALHKRLSKLHERPNGHNEDWVKYGMVHQINAYYNPTVNAMIFPAGILQSPFFSDNVPHYVNYGAIGQLMGHEMTHGFDDQGCQFNAEGDLEEWWDEKSKKTFMAKKQCIIDQYSQFKELTTQMNLDGINTQSENIADNIGMRLSFRAYNKLMEQLGRPEPGLPGLQKYSNKQLFILSFANVWCSKARPQALKNMINTDDHAPNEFRVNGVLMNLAGFGEIFGCEKGTPMNPENNCSV